MVPALPEHDSGSASADLPRSAEASRSHVASAAVPAPENVMAAEPPDNNSDDEDVHDVEDAHDDDFDCGDVGSAENSEGDDSRLQTSVVTCVERWRNAGPESRKKMFALFAISGVFVCICRHGHPLVICDMVRSGEL